MLDKKKFRAQLILAGKTMEETATHLGINVVTLYRKINGTSDFYRNEIHSLCDFLDIDEPNEIFLPNELRKRKSG